MQNKEENVKGSQKKTGNPTPQITTWGKVKQQISNLKNYVKYNLINYGSNLLDFSKFTQVRIFDKDFSTKIKNDLLVNELNFIIYFSYRSDFYPIIHNEELWTTDCGWGCMIRASQMMLSRAIFCLKLSEFQKTHETKEEGYVEHLRRLNVCFTTLMMFLETAEEITENTGFKYPYFSIYQVISHGLKIGKGPGQWFSDVNMVNIFSQINEENKVLGQIQILTFSDNLIEEETILKNCFKEKVCDCSQQQIRCICFKINDKAYEFERGGIIFVSSRVGLDSIDPMYFTPIARMFSIKNNIGLVGGRGNYAMYFVGVTDNNRLIYLDPHFKQYALKNMSEICLPDSQNSFLKKRFYFLDIKQASPAFTFGAYFNNLAEFKQLQYSLKLYSRTENAIFKYKALDNSLNDPDSAVKPTDDEIGLRCEDDDDFCVISK